MAKSAEIKYIYTLTDPRNDHVRYVGITAHPKKRSESHKINKNKNLGKWSTELRLLGYSPQFEIIDIVDLVGSGFWEMYYIGLFKSWGFNLFNQWGNTKFPKHIYPNIWSYNKTLKQ